jgi:predicted NBD/HSP70 family sugar kinase
MKPKMPAARVLVVDVGGSHVKCRLRADADVRKFASDAHLTPQRMVDGVREVTEGWRFDRVSIGYPGVVRHGVPVREPHNLGPGWIGFDYEGAFGCPVRMINDAAMQALGAYRGGKMLFLGLGTGLGSALIVDGDVLAMELGHLHWTKKRTYEDFLGKGGYARLGRKKWRRRVLHALRDFSAALLPDDIVVGGGQAERLNQLAVPARLGSNADAFAGGMRLWDDARITIT